MKKINIIYWITTGLTALGFLMSSVMYLTANEQIVQGFGYMKLPQYLIPFLGIAKAAGAVGILQTQSARLKEWAYIGLVINLVGAIYIHIVFGISFIAPLLFLALVFVSYYLHYKRLQFSKGLQLSH
jgi:hypothetical protein